MPPAPSVEQFLDLVVQSGLLTDDLVSPFRDGSFPGADTDVAHEALAGVLIRDRLLTPFQARQLLRGKFKGFFLTDKYKVLDHLGDGGMGKVFLCEHLILQRLVAVKLLVAGTGKDAPPQGAVERFYREARAVAALDHPNIVRVFDVDTARGSPFMVMEFVDGTDLHRFVTSAGPLPPNQAAAYVRQAALGLQHAHAAGLIHRDIKPGNLLLDRAGGVKILDLGLARFRLDTRRNDAVTERFDQNAVLGTADFIAPEQALNSSTVDIRADLYSLGCTLYFLLTGRMPFGDCQLPEKLLSHQMRMPTPVREVQPEVPKGLADVLTRMIAKKPDDRPATPQAVADLLAVYDDPAPGPPPSTLMPRVSATFYRLGLSSAPALGSHSGLHSAMAATPTPGQPTTAANTQKHRTTTTRPAVQVSGLKPPASDVMRAAPPPRTRAPGSDPARSPALVTPQSPTVSPRTMSKVRGPATPRTLDVDDAPLPAGPPTEDFPLGPNRRKSVMILASILGFLAVGGGLGLALWMNSGKATPVASGTGGNVLPWQSAPTTRPDDGDKPPAAATGVTIKGSGSSFVGPMMSRWAKLYADKSGVKVEYEAIGSGKGIDALLARKVDFGCTDAFIPDAKMAELKAKGEEVRHIPLVMGAVVPIYNLPDVGTQLHFTAKVLADIYLGRIKNWNDPAIAFLNPDAKLPNLPITVIHRKDSSGTTNIWTDYLSKVTGSRAAEGVKGDWELVAGPVGNTAKWPVGQPAEGSNGVAEAVNRQRGAIGYIELSYALEHNQSFAVVRNRAGEYAPPSLETVTAAADESLAQIPDDLRYTLTDPPGKRSYPIAGTSWAVIRVKPDKPNLDAVKFLDWATHEGQKFAPQLRYAPLPDDLKLRIDGYLFQLLRNQK